jgi:hypothetical protein
LDDDVALFGTESVVVQNASTVTGSDGTAAVFSQGGVHLASLAQVDDVFSGDNVFVGGQAVVNGNIVTGGVVEPQAGANLLGEEFEGAFIPEHEIDYDVDIPGGGPWLYLGPEQQMELTPGNYSSINVQRAARAILQPGVYNVGYFNIDRDGILDLPSGAVIINASNVRFVGQLDRAPSAPVSDLLIVYDGQWDAVFESNFTGLVLAPRGKILLGPGNGTTYRGSFFGDRVEVRAGVHVRFER